MSRELVLEPGARPSLQRPVASWVALVEGARGRSPRAGGSPARRRPRSPGSGTRAPPSGRTRAARRGIALRSAAARSKEKRSSISSGERRKLSRFPRRSGSQPSSEVRQRIATSTSWSSVRRGWCAWTSPVATVSTPRCSARSRRSALRRVSPRSNGRWSSTKKRSRPNAPREARRGVRVEEPEPATRAAGEADEPLGELGDQSRAGPRAAAARDPLAPRGRVPACAAVSRRQRFA